jgi:hypothetical protein
MVKTRSAVQRDRFGNDLFDRGYAVNTVAAMVRLVPKKSLTTVFLKPLRIFGFCITFIYAEYVGSLGSKERPIAE